MALAWFVAGILGLMFAGVIGYYGFLGVGIVIVAALAWFALKRRGDELFCHRYVAVYRGGAFDTESLFDLRFFWAHSIVFSLYLFF